MSGIVGSRFNIRGSGVVGKLGTDGQIFTSAGAGKSAIFEAAASAGKILQVQHVKIESNTTVTATSVTTTGVSDIITPSADSSKILVIMDVILGNYESSGAGTNAKAALYRDIGGAGFSAIYRDEGNYHAGYDGTFASGKEISSSFPSQMIFVDEPNTTSACTYTYYMCPQGSTVGDSANTGPSSQDSSVTLMEIDGS
ncbi:MAG: hypothetical protein QF535_22910 [Anaerolineales bacterium]|nr:hypothetical protein [Anaerolineales bacterium]|tara:strand:- start:359 stop:952 length:594 start_codon:yes stop_codon:yes gene_type:complete